MSKKTKHVLVLIAVNVFSSWYAFRAGAGIICVFRVAECREQPVGI